MKVQSLHSLTTKAEVVAVIGVQSSDSLRAPSVALQASPLPAKVGLAVLLLAAGGFLLRGFGCGRFGMAHRPRPRGSQSTLPASRSPLLFRPSHHETLHDPAYLERILQAELGDQPHGRPTPDAATGGDRCDAVGRC